ncbi:vWA domain-containing protein [Marinobacter sp. F4216]|uniref:vWA domain-containing protein n=1 Tax=Marinobacter sp. F4216 TaxID=2874281 RepID=UPI001CC13FB0|nr:VWA domain-containing protein [Marinobacter sp. F4216]MBZ2169826.1 VWA domain-containing protein [Marinobacter sp. F4216]
MGIDLEALHLLRPWGLIFTVAGGLLPLLWRRYQARTRHFSELIPERLARHLVVKTDNSHRFHPIHLLSALLILGGLGVAGPSWDKQRPAFMENRAPIILAVDLSKSMNRADVTPSRLELAKAKARALVSRNPSTRFGLIAYAGSAHLVLPPTRDADLINLYLEALSSDLIPGPGRNTSAVVKEAKRLLAASQIPGTLVFITDGIDPAQAQGTLQQLQGSDLQVLMLMTAADNPETPDTTEAMKRFADTINADIASTTANSDDLRWLELSALLHFRDAGLQDAGLHWKDMGYWLVWPILALTLLGVRRGWSLPAVVLALLLNSPGFVPPATAGPLADAFLTPDQQGQLAYEAGRFADAARLFQDPYLRGLAAYRAAQYDLAVASFRQVDTAQAWFYRGNSLAKQVKLKQAISTYEQALSRQPDFPAARDNLDTVLELQSSLEQQRSETPDMSADDVTFDSELDQGKQREEAQSRSLTEAVWLENLSTSPKAFLRRKFQYQNHSGGGSEP